MVRWRTSIVLLELSGHASVVSCGLSGELLTIASFRKRKELIMHFCFIIGVLFEGSIIGNQFATGNTSKSTINK